MRRRTPLRVLAVACWSAALLAGTVQAQLAAPEIGVTPLGAADGVHAGGEARVALQVSVPEGWHVNAHEPLQEYLIATEAVVEASEGLAVIETVYPEADRITPGFSDEALAVYGGTFHIGLALSIPEEWAPGEHAVKGTVRYQACNDTLCAAPSESVFALTLTVLPASQEPVPQHTEVFEPITFTGAAAPETTAAKPDVEAAEPDVSADDPALLSEFTVVAQAGGYMNADTFLEFLDAAESGEGATLKNALAGKSAWLVVLITLVGGLLLNLTPCVLPMIPINLGIIGAGAQAGPRSRGFALGGAYGLAIALTYGILGLVVVLTAGAFGTINATPWFNFAMAVIFIVLGLAMFDVLVIDFSKYQAKLGPKKSAGGSFVLAFFLGTVNALLAGACVAPVVIMVILYSQDAYAKGSLLGLALPFVLGAGMGLPWPLAGGGLAFLPKPGAWMVRVKQAFGVLILLMAAYYGYKGATLFGDRYLVDPAAVEQSAAAADEEGWVSSLSEGLARAKAEGKPVFIDFWATWCKNCLTMNKTTFKDPAVRARLDRYVAIKYQAELPDISPTKEILDRFDYVGLPHYAVLEPR